MLSQTSNKGEIILFSKCVDSLELHSRLSEVINYVIISGILKERDAYPKSDGRMRVFAPLRNKFRITRNLMKLLSDFSIHREAVNDRYGFQSVSLNDPINMGFVEGIKCM